MRMNSNKKHVIRIIIIVIALILIRSIKYYLEEYDFRGVNGGQPTVFYTVARDDVSKDKSYLTDANKMDKHFKDEFAKLGIQLYVTRKTDHLVEYDVVSSVEESKIFHQYVTKNYSELLKKAPLKSNSVADIIDDTQAENFKYNEKVGFRVVPAFNIPVIGILLSAVLNSGIGCVSSIVSLALFIVIFAFIPFKDDADINKELSQSGK